jgi:hypothetical protein
MRDAIESLRKELLRWNVAPLVIAGLMCGAGWLLLKEILDPTCDKTEWYVGILAGLLTGLFGFIFKIYESLQRNRGEQ